MTVYRDEDYFAEGKLLAVDRRTAPPAPPRSSPSDTGLFCNKRVVRPLFVEENCQREIFVVKKVVVLLMAAIVLQRATIAPIYESLLQGHKRAIR